MAGFFNMEIAGVYFTLTGEKSVFITDVDSVYKPFLKKKTQKLSSIGIKISLEFDSPLDPEKYKKIFDSGQSWSMFKDNDNYFLSFNPGKCKPFVWLLKTDRNFSRATLFCSRELISEKEGMAMISNPVVYPLDQILLMYILAQRQGILVHSCGFVQNNTGFLFPGRSGAGKTSLARQFNHKKKVEFLSDDRIVVRKMNHGYKAFGTPWPGEGKNALNRSAFLSKIFFIRHGSTNVIKKISPSQALEMLFPVVSIPWYDKLMLPGVLETCEDLIYSVPAYELSFLPGAAVVDVLEKFICKEKRKHL